MNTSWLDVGHVDEVVSLAPNGQDVIVADPDLAIGLLLWANKLNPQAAMLQGMNDPTGNVPPNGTTVAQVLNNIQLQNYNRFTVMNPVNLPSVWNTVENAMGIAPPESTPTAGAANPDNAALAKGGCFMAFLQNVVRRTYTITFTDNNGDYTLSYQDAGGGVVVSADQGNSSQDAVFRDARAYILSNWWTAQPKQGDTFQYTADPTSKVIEMPVLFYADPIPARKNLADEYTPDFVNSLIVNASTVITGKAFGPSVPWIGNGNGAATDIFQDYSDDAFTWASITGNPISVDGRVYSNADGFIHCATNVIRQIPTSKWWAA